MGADPSDVKLLVDTEKRVRALADVVCDDVAELYKVGVELGVGRFSTVRLGESVGTGKKFALKVVENASLNEEENLEALEQEVKILRMLQHPYVVKLKEVVMTSSRTYISMELLKGGELFEKIVEVGCYPEPEAAIVFARLVASVEFLHSRSIVHRDLKPENILFVEGPGSTPTDIKLIDFGYAGVWTPKEELSGLCGTPDYVAPEILSWYRQGQEEGEPGEGAQARAAGQKYGKSSDLWSLGVLLYVLLSGCSPFAADDEELLLVKVAGAQYTFPDKEWAHISAEARDVISRTLVVDPAKRISLADLKVHPWCRAAVEKVMAELKAAGVTRVQRDTERSASCASCAIQ